MTPLWTIFDVCAAVRGRLQNCEDGPIVGISIDTRTLIEHDLFVAIKGDRFDGHDFVEVALANKASAALVNAEFAANHPHLERLIVVDDALKGLERLGRAARARMKGKVVAVTGSVGKTSTKEALRIVLENFGKTHASIRSFNNHWGVPLMLARMPQDTNFGIFEIGMSHADEIRPLVAMVQPDIAIITKIAPAHLQNFSNIDGIADAKLEIIEGLKAEGTLILGADHDHFEYLKQKAQRAGVTTIKSYGFADQTDLHLASPKMAQGNIASDFEYHNVAGTFAVPQFGVHALANVAAAFLVGHIFGLDNQKLIDAATQYDAPDGRGALHKLTLANGTALLIDESYNANPSSMRAAMHTLQQFQDAKRKCVVLGDMLELGEQSAHLHAELAADLSKSAPDKIILVGAQMKFLADALEGHRDVVWQKSRDELLTILANWLAPGDVVMVKGSNGIGLGTFVQQCVDRWSSE